MFDWSKVLIALIYSASGVIACAILTIKFEKALWGIIKLFRDLNWEELAKIPVPRVPREENEDESSTL